MSRPAFLADKSLTLQAQFDLALAFIATQAADLTAGDQLLGETNGKLTASEARVVELTNANTDLNGKLTAADVAKVAAEAAKVTAEQAATEFDAKMQARAVELFASQGGSALAARPGSLTATDDSVEGLQAALAAEKDPAKRYTLAKKLGALRTKATR